jgi:hypothetical protein
MESTSLFAVFIGVYRNPTTPPQACLMSYTELLKRAIELHAPLSQLFSAAQCS